MPITPGGDHNFSLLLHVLCVSLASVICYIDLQIPLGVAGGVPYILVVLVAMWIPQRRFIIIAALITSCLTILGYFLSPPGGELWKVLSNRGLALFAIWVTALLSRQRRLLEMKNEAIIAEREKALDDVKILRGFLPICAACKKIRDDKGYWNQIEAYIHEHSEAEFSHSVCPECLPKLYPDLADSVLSKLDE